MAALDLAGWRSTSRKRSVPAASASALVISLLWAAASLAQAPQAAAPNRFDYSRDEASVVVVYRESLGELLGGDGPSLRVYGDGLALVHYPPAMKRAGNYSVRMSRDELDQLVSTLVVNEVVEFDEERAREDRSRARSRSGVLHHVADASIVTIEIRLDRYVSARAGASARHNLHKRVSWRGLRSDSRRYPGVESIQKLAVARRELEAVMQRADLVRGR